LRTVETRRLRVLIAEDSPNDAELMLRELRRGGFDVVSQRVDTPEAFAEGLTPDLDLILCDYVMPRFDAPRALSLLQDRGLDIPFLIVSGTIGEDLAVAAMRGGAADYLLKDRLARLGPAVRLALEKHQLRRAHAQAAESLQKSEVRFRALIENSSDAVSMADAQGRITYSSPAVTRVLGYQPAEIENRLAFELFHPEDADRAQTALAQLLASPAEPVTVRLRMRHKQDHWCWVEAVARNLLDDANIGALVVNYRDIADRIQHELELEAIADLSQALRNAVSRADVLAVVLDQAMALLQAAAGTLQLLASTGQATLVEQARGEWAPLLGQSVPLTAGVNHLVLSSGQPYRHDHTPDDPRFLRAALTPNTSAVLCVPLLAEGAQPIGVFWIGRPTPINSGEQRLLMAMADMAASAIHRAILYEQTQIRLQRLATLRAIDLAINASLDLTVTLNVLLTEGQRQLGVDAVSLLLYEPGPHTLAYAAGRGFRTTAAERAHVPLGASYAGRVAQERRTRSLSDPSLADAGMRAFMRAEGFAAYIGVPLIAKGQLQGVFEIFHRGPLQADPEWLEFLETLAGQAALAIDNATVYADLQRSHAHLRLAYDTTLEGWSRALDLRDRETEGHTRRVTELSLRLAEAMGLSGEALLHLRRGALLHDIGKLGVPDHILHKPGPLTDEEWAVMRQHPVYAYELLRPIDYLGPALDIPYCHHEKWDGSGYPRGLKADAIPLSARIFAVADVWDALRSDRPYRPRWSAEQSRAYLTEQSGRHFDPRVVNVFMGLLQSGGLPE
jgi:PAS domain S-box-containing protein